MRDDSSRGYASLLTALVRPTAFPCVLSPGEVITTIQTHASVVFLTDMYVYKLKKPKNLGFFDYSTPLLRRHFCGQEVLLNARLAPHIYLGVAPVLACASDVFRFGPTLAPENLPEPGSLLDGGEVVDYAVVMVRLPDEAMLGARIDADSIEPSLLTEVARYVAAFHQTTCTNEHIASFGRLEVIRGNWEENFEQMSPYIGRSLSAATYECIVTYIRRFMDEHSALFAQRVRAGRIRDCHGDLRLQHVYLLDQLSASDHAQSVQPVQPRLAILDCIEFNERFRYSDVVAEIAFLAMEMDAAGRADLAHIFIDSYVAATGDEEVHELLPFYACYRACVRGKVSSFQLDDTEISASQHEMVRQEATLLFEQAASYASGPTRPLLVMVGGLMGTGKSTLAHILKQQLGWALCSSDTTRKRLAQMESVQPGVDGFDKGLYSSEWTARTYATLRQEAAAALGEGRSVLLDASFLRRADRLLAAQVAAQHGAGVLFMECICPREIVLQRLARRWEMRVQGKLLSLEEASRASDGRPDIYDIQRMAWEDFDVVSEVDIEHIILETTLPLAVNVENILAFLQIPHAICRQLTLDR